MSDELKPCPFCGSAASRRNDALTKGVEGVIECPECGAAAFVSAWQEDRPIEDALRADYDALKTLYGEEVAHTRAEIASLKEVVRAADALREERGPTINVCICAVCSGQRRDAYDAARAKVKL